MRAALGVMFQNYGDLDRFEAMERGEAVDPPIVTDAAIWEGCVRLCELAEPLGFDSLFTFEHRNTPYLLLPNPLQLLSYIAGRTRRIDVGTMVVVLPWHHPIRLAEEVSMLQHLLGPNRRFTMGVGRGLSRREFSALGVPMDESRERFAEVLDILRTALRNERFSYDGQFHKIPETSIRPQPRDTSVVDDMYCAWGSVGSIPVAAESGLNALIIPTRSLFDLRVEMAKYAEVRREHGFGAPQRPIAQIHMYCSESHAQADEATTLYFEQYADSAIRHYEMGGSHFDALKGYESYRSKGGWTPGAASPAEGMREMYKRDSVWGTPDECIQRIEAINELIGPSEIIFVTSEGTMPADEAERSIRLFAEKVLPAVHAMAPMSIDYETAPV